MQPAEMERGGAGLVMAVTGANRGLGLEACAQLGCAEGVAKVVLLCRSKAKADGAMAKLRSVARAKLAYVECDTSSLDSCRKAALALKEVAGGKLDGLLLNAGGMPDGDPTAVNADSKCSNIFTVNVLGHVALLEGLVGAGCTPDRRRATPAGSKRRRRTIWRRRW